MAEAIEYPSILCQKRPDLPLIVTSLCRLDWDRVQEELGIFQVQDLYLVLVTVAHNNLLLNVNKCLYYRLILYDTT